MTLFPAQAADLEAKYAASLAALPDDVAKVNGIAVGHQAASGILTARAHDGRDAGVIYTPGLGPAVWVPTPPAFLAAQAPETPFVQPFALHSASQFRPEAPFGLASEDWARDYNEVKAFGSAVGSSRNAEQTDIARFWSDNPPLQWNRAWRALSMAEGLGLADNARYFAMLSTASADALIACWDAKSHYNFWRPVTAIRAGDSDGNLDTAPDATWIGLIVTPNHPEYPAAHGCFSGASTETLKYSLAPTTSGSGWTAPLRGREPHSNLSSLFRGAGGGPRRPDLWRNALQKLDPNGRARRKACVQVYDEPFLPPAPDSSRTQKESSLTDGRKRP